MGKVGARFWKKLILENVFNFFQGKVGARFWKKAVSQNLFCPFRGDRGKLGATGAR